MWLSLFAAAYCQAENDTLYTEADLFGDIPVVSAVSRFEQRLDQAPASVTILSRELIEMSGAQTFVDVFRLVPGFQSYYVSHNRYGVSYHGIGREFPNQIEVMVDGRSVYETLFSSVSWSTLGIGLEDVDHIEVVRGSNAAARGSNAFMGSINIITRKPIQESGFTAKATLGDLQTRRVSLVDSGRVGEIDTRLSLAYDKNDGFPAFADGSLEDGHELAYGNLRATYTPTVADTVDLSVGYAHERLGWGDSDHPDDYSIAHNFSNFQMLEWTHSAHNRHEFHLQAYHNRLKTTNLEELGPLYQLLGIDDQTAAALTAVIPPTQDAVEQFSALSGLGYEAASAILGELNTGIYGGYGRLFSERYDLQFQHDFTLSDIFRGTWGAGVRRDLLESYHPQSISAKLDETNYRLYSHVEWRIMPKLTLNGGAMVEDTHVGTLFSPRISANYSPAPNHGVRLAYARGNRAPSLLEANEASISHVGDVIYDILRIADPNLREETIDSYELAYMYHSNEPGISLDLRVFREEVHDVIDEVRDTTPAEVQIFGDTSLKRLENTDYWEFTGAEIQLNYQVTPKTFVRAHYTRTDFNPQIGPPNPGFKPVTKDDRVAKHSAGLMLHHRFTPHWSASVVAYYQSKLRWEDGDDVGAITRVDGSLGYKFNLGQQRVKVSLVVQNVGDDYSEFNDNNLFQTRYFLTAELEIPN